MESETEIIDHCGIGLTTHARVRLEGRGIANPNNICLRKVTNVEKNQIVEGYDGKMEFQPAKFIYVTNASGKRKALYILQPRPGNKYALITTWWIPEETRDKPFRIIIAGTRTFNDKLLMFDVCDYYTRNKDNVYVVSGGAKGADALGEAWAMARARPCKVFEADWTQHGKSAGIKRNIEMSLAADALIALWDGKSRGTEHMIKQARKENLAVRVVRYDLLAPLPENYASVQEFH